MRERGRSAGKGNGEGKGKRRGNAPPGTSNTFSVVPFFYSQQRRALFFLTETRDSNLKRESTSVETAERKVYRSVLLFL